MKKERLQAKLADIAELDSAVDRDAALHKLWLKLKKERRSEGYAGKVSQTHDNGARRNQRRRAAGRTVR